MPDNPDHPDFDSRARIAARERLVQELRKKPLREIYKMPAFLAIPRERNKYRLSKAEVVELTADGMSMPPPTAPAPEQRGDDSPAVDPRAEAHADRLAGLRLPDLRATPEFRRAREAGRLSGLRRKADLAAAVAAHAAELDREALALAARLVRNGADLARSLADGEGGAQAVRLLDDHAIQIAADPRGACPIAGARVVVWAEPPSGWEGIVRRFPGVEFLRADVADAPAPVVVVPAAPGSPAPASAASSSAAASPLPLPSPQAPPAAASGRYRYLLPVVATVEAEGPELTDAIYRAEACLDGESRRRLVEASRAIAAQVNFEEYRSEFDIDIAEIMSDFRAHVELNPDPAPGRCGWSLVVTVDTVVEMERVMQKDVADLLPDVLGHLGVEIVDPDSGMDMYVSLVPDEAGAPGVRDWVVGMPDYEMQFPDLNDVV